MLINSEPPLSAAVRFPQPASVTFRGAAHYTVHFHPRAAIELNCVIKFPSRPICGSNDCARTVQA